MQLFKLVVVDQCAHGNEKSNEYTRLNDYENISIPVAAGRGISAETWGLDDVFHPDDFGSGPYIPFIIYISYMIAAI